MGLLDSVIGGLLGGGASNAPMNSILSSILGGQSATGTQGASQPGLMGLLSQFAQAGHGDVANSWVGNGPNQPIAPSALQQVFGEGQINQWSQQTGLQPHDLLSQLSQFLPHAVDKMTPNGEVPTGPTNPFDEAGVTVR